MFQTQKLIICMVSRAPNMAPEKSLFTTQSPSFSIPITLALGKVHMYVLTKEI